MAKENVYGVKPKVKVVEETKTEQYNEFFTLVTRNGKTRIACGNAIVSHNEFDSLKDAKSYIDKKPWELIINITCYVQDKLHEQSK